MLLFRVLFLRPHGGRLLTFSGSMWLVFANVLVLAMAISESVAWGYTGSQLGTGTASLIYGGFTALIVFCMVFAIDASLITMDRAYTEHSAELAVHESSRRDSSRSWVSILIRIGVLAVSMTITAPYLAELVFWADIDKHIAEKEHKQDSADKAALEQEMKRELDGIKGDRDGKEKEYEAECAGLGPSHRYGCKDAAGAINAAVLRLNAEIDATETNNADKLARFDEDREVHKRPGPMEIRKALNELVNADPEYRTSEYTIMAFLGLIFAGLLLLKLYEPHSIRLYFSEILQMEYERYLAGTFDDKLHVTERSSASRPIGPKRFYEFLRHRKQDVAGRLLDELEHTRNLIADELKAVKGERDALRETRNAESERLAQAKSEWSQWSGELKDRRTQLNDLRTSAGGGLDGQARIEFASSLRRGIADLERPLRDLEQKLPSLTDSVRRFDEDLEDAELRLSRKKDDLRSAETAIRDFRAREMSSGNRAWGAAMGA